MRARSGSALAAVALTLAVAGCAGTRPDDLGVREGRLPPCPSSANCVSSDADPTDEEHFIEPFTLIVAPERAWREAEAAVVADLSRTEVVTRTEDYLHVECRSLIFRFVDDLELHLRPDEGVIAVRSASRLGSNDLGVNRSRVEELREALAARGVAR